MIRLPKLQVVLFTLIFMISIPISSFGVDGQRKLTQPVPPATFPIVLNQPGSYVLTSNLVVTDQNTIAIEITVNNVTIDLNGFTIQGPNAGTGHGIFADNQYNITIRNGRVWGFGNMGIWLDCDLSDPSIRGAGHLIEWIQVMNNATAGIVIHGGIVRNCVVNNNSGGGAIVAVNSIVTQCTTNNNGAAGIRVTNSIVTRCTANYNYGQGIDTDSNIEGDANTRIEGNNVRNNSIWGIFLWGENDYAIRNTGSENGPDPSYNFFAITGNYMPITGDNANYGF